MFEQLPESQARHERHAGQMAVSLAVHTCLIAAAIFLTERAAAAPAVLAHVAATFFTPPKLEPPPTPPRPAVMRSVPVAQGFQTLVPPKTIPLGLPPVDLNANFDRRDYDGTGVPGGRFDGIPGGVPSAVEGVANMVYQSEQVDDPVQLLKAAEPKYPNALRVAGVTGSVTFEFVVSPEGKVVESSVRTIRVSDPRFEGAAREAILQSTYRPARYRGSPVAQLVSQTVNFAVAP